jgi:hypothetical protein
VIRTARKYHKWLMAFVGIQFLIWSITGLYMVSMDIHFIHGETLQNTKDDKVDLSIVSYPIIELMTTFPTAENITLVKLLDRQVYQLSVAEPAKKWLVVDAKTGELQPEINREQSIKIALQNYSHLNEIREVKLISDKNKMPPELSPRHLPVWQVTFEHYASPTFYISQQSGKVVTKRHDFWRLFDWMWRFHIMDYDDGENVANWFLLVIALTGILATFAGAVLTYIRIVKPNNVKGKVVDKVEGIT